MRALLAAGRRPNVTIRVTPYTAGAHAGLDGTFIILSFPEDVAPDVGYVETRIGDGYAESSGTVQRLGLDFEAVEAAALSPGESAEFVAATT